jgi:hypothetical protein
MTNSCIICKVEASRDLQLQHCGACQSAMYCSRAWCQKTDWKVHKQICKLLNVGHGCMQVRTDAHTSHSIHLKEQFESEERSFDEDVKRFFKLFEESTFEGSQAAAQKMRKIVKRHTKNIQKFVLFHSLHRCIRSDSKMLSWPNSPLLVMLQLVGPSVLTGLEDGPLQEGYTRATPLHMLATLADSSDYSTHENQLILAKQLVEHGANVNNAESIPLGGTPLQHACYPGNVTNLDFVQLLLMEGADPNLQDCLGRTPLMYTIPYAPGAAKFLLNWPTTDANITSRSGASFLALVRSKGCVEAFSSRAAHPGNPDQVKHHFLLQQWREIEEMLVGRGANDTGITAI